MDTRICSHFIWVTSVGLHLSAKLLVYLLSCSSVHASCCSQCCTSELVGSLFARWRKRFDVCWSGERLVNSAKDLLTVAWDVAPQGLTQRPPPPCLRCIGLPFSFSVPWPRLSAGVFKPEIHISPSTMAGRTECGSEDGSRDAEEATWGCQRAARLPFLPTPPSHLLLFKSAKKQNLRQGRGTDICRED